MIFNWVASAFSYRSGFIQRQPHVHSKDHYSENHGTPDSKDLKNLWTYTHADDGQIKIQNY